MELFSLGWEVFLVVSWLMTHPSAVIGGLRIASRETDELQLDPGTHRHGKEHPGFPVHGKRGPDFSCTRRAEWTPPVGRRKITYIRMTIWPIATVAMFYSHG